MINLDDGEIQDIDDKILYDPSKRFVLIVERLKELPVTSPFYKVTQAPNGILEDYRFNTTGLWWFMQSRGNNWPNMPEVSLEKLQKFEAPQKALDSYHAFMNFFREYYTA